MTKFKNFNNLANKLLLFIEIIFRRKNFINFEQVKLNINKIS